MYTRLVFASTIVDTTPVSAFRTYTFPHCWVNVSLEGDWVQTVFHDGTQVVATPEACAEQVQFAEQLGYGADVAAMSREHELLHTFLSLRLRGGASPTLWAVAHGQGAGVAPIWEQECEEAVVLAFQAYLNGREEASNKALAELPLEILKSEALRLLRF